MKKRKAAPTKPRAASTAVTFWPKLAKGERYAGILLDEKGAPSHHLVLLAGERDDLQWSEAVAWAKKQGGELPTRPEQALLFANAKSEFQPRWYWSSEKHASDSDYAWCQGFGSGLQDCTGQSDKLRARAVRRVPIR